MRKGLVGSVWGAVCLLCFSCNVEEQKGGTVSPENEKPESTALLLTFDEQTAEDLLDVVPTKSGISVKTGITRIDDAFAACGVTSFERVFPDAGEWEERHREAGLHRFYYVKCDPDQASDTKAGNVLTKVQGISGVENMPRLKLLSETATFNDPYLTRQWHYANPGTGTKYKAGADINVVPVWNNYTAGSSDVIVAVVDGGVDLTHEDLGAVVIPGGSDGSWNFVDGSTKIVAHDHGTHVAGTIAAINNNGIGVCGIAGGNDGTGGVKILSCQIFRTNSKGKDEFGGSSNAIVWGADHGAVISQNSWGYEFDTESQAQRGSIDSADKAAVDYFIKYAGTDKNGKQTGPMKGGVVIFAAGNDGWSVGWPGKYDPIISVGAMASNGNRAYYSNYGDWVDIAAPGGDAYVGPQIVSTVSGSGYDEYQGTSMACPHVSGVAALIVSYFGGEGFTNEMLMERLFGGANSEFLEGASIGPLVDAYGSFTYGSVDIPEKVSDYTVTGRGGSVQFDWTVGASAEGKAAYGYLLLASGNEADFTGLNLRNLPSTVKAASVSVGELKKDDAISGSLGDLDFDTDYYVAIAGYDYWHNYSELSEVKTVKTTVNNPPVIEPVTELPWEVPASGKFTAQVNIYDPDGHYVNVSFTKDEGLKSLTQSKRDGYYYISVNGLQEEPGDYKVSYKATDTYGASTTREFAIKVKENHAPQVVKEFENLIFEKKAQSQTFNISDYFVDPDGDALTFQVTHTNSKVAHLNPLGDEIVLTTLSYGNDIVTVKALDPRKAEAELTFQISVRDPKAGADVYPTQVTDVLKVSGGVESDTHVQIWASTGTLVFDQTLTSSAFKPAEIDMSGFAPGIYKVKVTINGIETVKTVVKL